MFDSEDLTHFTTKGCDSGKGITPVKVPAENSEIGTDDDVLYVVLFDLLQQV